MVIIFWRNLYTERQYKFMGKYKVIIEETVVQAFEIDTADENDAYEKAIDKYKKAEFVLDNPEVQYKQLAVENPGSDLIWREF